MSSLVFLVFLDLPLFLLDSSVSSLFFFVFYVFLEVLVGLEFLVIFGLESFGLEELG